MASGTTAGRTEIQAAATLVPKDPWDVQSVNTRGVNIGWLMLLVLNVGNEVMTHFITINIIVPATPVPIHLRETHLILACSKHRTY